MQKFPFPVFTDFVKKNPLKSWHFEASEDIITKFKSQSLYAIEIKFWNASGSDFPPSLINVLRNIGILHHKKAKLPKHLQHSVFNIMCLYLFDWTTFSDSRTEIYHIFAFDFLKNLRHPKFIPRLTDLFIIIIKFLSYKR